MRTSGNTVLITGRATGTGRATAGALLDAGSLMIICGRREDRLYAARRRPALYVRKCDVANVGERRARAELDRAFAWTNERM